MLLTRCWEKSDVNVLKLMTLCPLTPRMNLFFFFLDKSLIGDIAGSRAWSCRNHKCPFQDNVCGQGHALGRQDLLVCVPMGQTSSLVLFLASCLNFWTPWGLCEWHLGAKWGEWCHLWVCCFFFKWSFKNNLKADDMGVCQNWIKLDRVPPMDMPSCSHA